MLFPNQKIERRRLAMILKDYAKLTAVLRLKTGLHIGTGEKVERGEPLPVIESRRTRFPYIPGSSLKGKMRSLLELTYGLKETDPKDKGSPCWCGKCPICLLFGSGSANKTYEPSRLIFRDCYLTKQFEDLLEKTELEEKPGVRIDRLTGKAAGGALFPMRRVPEGFEFKFEISARIFDQDNGDSIRKWLAMGLFLMEQDALGGGGTRGSGAIEFEYVSFDGKEFTKDWRSDCRREKDHLTSLQIKGNQ
jgi:CRISPR-associated protein Csm3